MNTKNLHQIFANYIDRFEELNDPEHNETFKWWAAKQFRKQMDAAFKQSGHNFAVALDHIKGHKKEERVIETIIDGKMQPFDGLVKISQQNEEAANSVKRLFQDLFKDDCGDLEKREEKIAAFLEDSEKLRLKYFPNYYSYKQTARSVAGYLFLYEPDKYYMYKANEAKLFADCVEYYGDWGTGDQIKLKEYYRMCDELVAEIKNCKELMSTDKSRFDGHFQYIRDDLANDEAKHILAYDIIYCTSVYNLYKGLTFKNITFKEKKLYQERLNKALALQEEYQKAEEEYALLDQAVQHYDAVFVPGTAVANLKYGPGRIVARRDAVLDVQFESQPDLIKYDFWQTVTGHYLKFEDSLDKETAQQYEDIFRRHDGISSGLVRLQKELEGYQDVLE